MFLVALAAAQHESRPSASARSTCSPDASRREKTADRQQMNSTSQEGTRWRWPLAVVKGVPTMILITVGINTGSSHVLDSFLTSRGIQRRFLASHLPGSPSQGIRPPPSGLPGHKDACDSGSSANPLISRACQCLEKHVRRRTIRSSLERHVLLLERMLQAHARFPASTTTICPIRSPFLNQCKAAVALMRHGSRVWTSSVTSLISFPNTCLSVLP